MLYVFSLGRVIQSDEPSFYITRDYLEGVRSANAV